MRLGPLADDEPGRSAVDSELGGVGETGNQESIQSQGETGNQESIQSQGCPESIQSLETNKDDPPVSIDSESLERTLATTSSEEI